MEFMLKDLLYIGGLLGGFISTWVALKYRIISLEKKQKDIDKVIYDNDTGALAIVTVSECKSNRKELNTEITDFKKEIRGIERELRKLSEYVLIIMVHMDIEPDKIKNRRKNN